jgi:hypothetical protein
MENPNRLDAQYIRWNEENATNVQRLIAYNNRRVLIGLRPLACPQALITARWGGFHHRDEVKLFVR